MPLRLLPPLPAPSETPPEQPTPEGHRGFWRTSLLLITSAAFGGIAVAIWNRRTLALMRQQGEHPTPSSTQE